jgi:hypothetical protein
MSNDKYATIGKLEYVLTNNTNCLFRNKHEDSF